MDRGILRSAITVLWKDRGLFAMLDAMFAETRRQCTFVAVCGALWFCVNEFHDSTFYIHGGYKSMASPITSYRYLEIDDSGLT